MASYGSGKFLKVLQKTTSYRSFIVFPKIWLTITVQQRPVVAELTIFAEKWVDILPQAYDIQNGSVFEGSRTQMFHPALKIGFKNRGWQGVTVFFDSGKGAARNSILKQEFFRSANKSIQHITSIPPTEINTVNNSANNFLFCLLAIKMQFAKPEFRLLFNYYMMYFAFLV